MPKNQWISYHGRLSGRINEIKQDLLDVMVKIEVTIDYPEYDVEEMTNNEVRDALEDVKSKLEVLEATFKQGKLLRNGIKTVIVGKPNVGKSSLLNVILNEDRAIVSNIEGTTRDSIEEMVNIRDIPIKLIDTAGIRDTENEIEKIGVEKSKKLVEESDLIIAIFDNSRKFDDEDEKILEIIKNKNAIIVVNKIDVAQENKEVEEKIKELKMPVVKVSTINNDGIDQLYDEIYKLFEINKIDNSNEIIITNERHRNQIHKAIEAISNAINTTNLSMPVDVISIDIKNAADELSEITGDNVTDDVIDEIFKKFCLGK